jgi:hypothetical protein
VASSHWPGAALQWFLVCSSYYSLIGLRLVFAQFGRLNVPNLVIGCDESIQHENAITIRIKIG